MFPTTWQWKNLGESFFFFLLPLLCCVMAFHAVSCLAFHCSSFLPQNISCFSHHCYFRLYRSFLNIWICAHLDLNLCLFLWNDNSWSSSLHTVFFAPPDSSASFWSVYTPERWWCWWWSSHLLWRQERASLLLLSRLNFRIGPSRLSWYQPTN